MAIHDDSYRAYPSASLFFAASVLLCTPPSVRANPDLVPGVWKNITPAEPR